MSDAEAGMERRSLTEEREPRYGPLELRAWYGRYLSRGLGIAVAIHLFTIGFYYADDESPPADYVAVEKEPARLHERRAGRRLGDVPFQVRALGRTVGRAPAAPGEKTLP